MYWNSSHVSPGVHVTEFNFDWLTTWTCKVTEFWLADEEWRLEGVEDWEEVYNVFQEDKRASYEVVDKN